MHVLVTGGCGYIGSALIPHLQSCNEVSEITVLDSLVTGSPRNLLDARLSTDFAFVQGDVRNYGDVESAMRETDIVIHLAAITGAASTHDRREETFAVNLDGTKNVLTAAKKLDVENVVYASSCNNYGRATSTEIKETVEPQPINPYAETKHKGEHLLKDLVTSTDIQGTALRMSTNYGYAPGIRFNLVVNQFVFRALTDRPLTVYGDGSNWRPFIHVEDAARAYRHAAIHPDSWQHAVYNVGSNAENYRIEDVARIIREELDAEPEITYLADKQPGPSYHVNFDRLDHTGYTPHWTLREGVRELAERFTDGTVTTSPQFV